MKRVLVCISLLLAAIAAPAAAQAQDKFDTFRAAEKANGRILIWRGRLKEERLAAQFQQLKEKRIPTMRLARLLDQTIRRSDGTATPPDKATALVFDQSPERFVELVWPHLRRSGRPATLLIDPESVEPSSAKILIGKLQRAGISIGLKLPAKVSGAAARKRYQNLIALTRSAPVIILRGEGIRTTAPLAETLEAIPKLTTDNAVVEPGTPHDAVPAFVVSHVAANSNRFKAILNARPLPVSGVTPGHRILESREHNPPAFGFSIPAGLDDRIGGLTCKASGNNRVSIERLGPYRIEVRLARRFSPGLHRIDCILPGSGARGNVRWRWYGVRFQVER